MNPQSYYPVMQVYGVEIPTRCFVGGLPYSMTELELSRFFSQFGTVKDSKIITDRNGVSKGYGFVTFQTEQEAADVCARNVWLLACLNECQQTTLTFISHIAILYTSIEGSLYYKEKKLNISKAIRRQGGQYSKANQEYVNGQRMVYQSMDGYLLAQKNGSWVLEEPSPFCQPAKPCFQILSPPPPPVFTAPYIQPPVPPAYYQALPPAGIPSYEPLPPDPGSLLYEAVPGIAPLPPPQQHIQGHSMMAGFSPPPGPQVYNEEKQEGEEDGHSDGESTTPSHSATTSISTSSLDRDMAKCSLTSEEETEKSPAPKKHSQNPPILKHLPSSGHSHPHHTSH